MKIIPIMTLVFISLVIVKGAIFLEEEDVDIPDPVDVDFTSTAELEQTMNEALENISDSWDAPTLFDNTTTGFWDWVTGDNLATVIANFVEIIFEIFDYVASVIGQSFRVWGVAIPLFAGWIASFFNIIADIIAWAAFFVTMAFTPIPDAPWYVNGFMVFFSGLYILALILNIFRGSDVS